MLAPLFIAASIHAGVPSWPGPPDAAPTPARGETTPADAWRRQYHELILEGQPAEGANAAELAGPVAERIKAITAEVIAKKFPGTDPQLVDLQALTRDTSNAQEKEIARAVLEELLGSDVPAMVAQLGGGAAVRGPGGRRTAAAARPAAPGAVPADRAVSVGSDDAGAGARRP